MSRTDPPPALGLESLVSRRQFLGSVYSGLAGIGLAHLSTREVAARTFSKHHLPRAQRVLQIFCPGAASHIDLWEHKPALEKFHGTSLPGEENFVSFQGKNGTLMRSPWAFQPRGDTGKMITSMLPHMSRHVDDIAFVHSMTSKSNTHGPGCIFMNTGHTTEGFPSAGAWCTYALGSANENLPAYVAITDIRGEPPNGKANWASGFLPAQQQGVMISAQQSIRNLATPQSISAAEERATYQFLEELNRRHAERAESDSDLEARMAAYELAGRMQLSAPGVCDLSSESNATCEMYGTNDANQYLAAYARNCVLARRLLEQGVRYVNLYCASRASGVDGSLNWDAHKTLKADYERHCPVFDKPTAALLTDLKQRGLLDDTLILWTTEFGRMPTHQVGTQGRDHNPDGFTCWMMGAGVEGGVSYGSTDEFGRRAAEHPSTVWDFYATVMYLLGLDHERVTFYHNGLDRRLTDVHGNVIHDIIST